MRDRKKERAYLMRVTDEWLYKKMPIVDAAMVKRLEDDIDKEYVFSDKFIRHMNWKKEIFQMLS